MQQRVPLELVAGLEPRRLVQRLFGDAQPWRVQKRRRDVLRQASQRLRKPRRLDHARGGQIGFGQVHDRILRRAAHDLRPIGRQGRHIETLAGTETLLDDVDGGQQGLARPRIARYRAKYAAQANTTKACV